MVYRTQYESRMYGSLAYTYADHCVIDERFSTMIVVRLMQRYHNSQQMVEGWHILMRVQCLYMRSRGFVVTTPELTLGF